MKLIGDFYKQIKWKVSNEILPYCNQIITERLNADIYCEPNADMDITYKIMQKRSTHVDFFYTFYNEYNRKSNTKCQCSASAGALSVALHLSVLVHKVTKAMLVHPRPTPSTSLAFVPLANGLNRQHNLAPACQEDAAVEAPLALG